MFQKIIVGVDGSEAANKALKVACDLTKKYGAVLHVVNAPREETSALVAAGYGGYGAVTAEPLDAHFKEVGQRVIEAATDLAKSEGVSDVESHIVLTSPAEAITELANEVGADLIITGRRGLGNIASLFLGSTSLQVVKSADCACLTIR